MLKRMGRGAVGLGVMVAVLTCVSSAAAKPLPTVSWTSARRASVGAPIPVSWKSRALPAGATLVVQRPVGTAHVFKTVRKLTGTSGSATIPAQKSLGTYRYRLAALEGAKVIAKQAVTIGVFGEVPFTALLHKNADQVFATSSTSFPYLTSYVVGEEGPGTIFSVTPSQNHCSSVHVDFVFGISFYAYKEHEAEYASHASATVSVVQQSADPVAGSANFNQTGSVDAQLVPGQSWSLVASETNTLSHEGNINFTSVYVNGSAICDSAEPLS